jgi:methyltransferase (TIGR00027 family)
MRSDGDRWGIHESVGVTALGVAASRAAETRRPEGLVRDPYAEEFVLAAGPQMQMSFGRCFDDPTGASSTYIGVRSRFFDQFCAESAPGVTQTVILAAGLDTRALRLAWPSGSTVFEIDQTAVLAFKDQVLAGRNGGGARRVLVPVDLRDDWAAALLTAGFDPAQPSSWLVEGLLPYLPASAEADLFDRIDTLSHHGSRIAVEQVDTALLVERSEELSALLGIDIAELMYIEHREDPARRLRRRGWTVSWTTATDFAEANERDLDEARFGGIARFVRASKPAPHVMRNGTRSF